MPFQEQGSSTKAQGTILPDDKWHYVGESGEPAFEGTWVNYDAEGTGQEQARFMKDAAGMVHIQGTIKSGTINTTAFTLPNGYYPSEHLRFATISGSNAVGRLDINSSGTVVPVTGGTAYYSINVSFYKG